MADASGFRRMDFDEAVAYVAPEGRCAFAAVPVFGNDGDTAEGARVFLLQRAEAGGYQLRFIAAPFFSTAVAADEIFTPANVPERVKELLFTASACEEAWCSEQIQVLIAKLVHAAGLVMPEMPDYLASRQKVAAPEVSFPVAMIRRAGDPDTGP